jgi:hypothetical protein
MNITVQLVTQLTATRFRIFWPCDGAAENIFTGCRTTAPFAIKTTFTTGHQVQGFTPADGFAGRQLYLVYCSAIAALCSSVPWINFRLLLVFAP